MQSRTERRDHLRHLDDEINAIDAGITGKPVTPLSTSLAATDKSADMSQACADLRAFISRARSQHVPDTVAPVTFAHDLLRRARARVTEASPSVQQVHDDLAPALRAFRELLPFGSPQRVEMALAYAFELERATTTSYQQPQVVTLLREALNELIISHGPAKEGSTLVQEIAEMLRLASNTQERFPC